MNLSGDFDAEEGDAGWHAKVRARVTFSDCWRFVYFERELRTAVIGLGNIAKIYLDLTDRARLEFFVKRRRANMQGYRQRVLEVLRF
jgi:hypothetical protein